MSECKGGEMMVPRRFIRSWRIVFVAVAIGVVATIAFALIGVLSSTRLAFAPPYCEDVSAQVAWGHRHSIFYDKLLWGTSVWAERPYGFYRPPLNAKIVNRALPRWSIWYTAQANELRMDAWAGTEVGAGFPFRYLTGHSFHTRRGKSVEVDILHRHFRGNDIEIPTHVRYGRLLANVLFFTLMAYVLLGGLVFFHAELRSRRGECKRCGYKLLGLTCGHCPECGEPILPRPLANTSSIRAWRYRRPRRRRRDL